MSPEKFHAEYARLAHAVQSGIKICLEHDVERGESMVNLLKHIRVGVDTMKSDQGALTDLLVQKGIITDEEYFAAILECLAREVRMYEQILSQRYGLKITLA